MFCVISEISSPSNFFGLIMDSPEGLTSLSESCIDFSHAFASILLIAEAFEDELDGATSAVLLGKNPEIHDTKRDR